VIADDEPVVRAALASQLGACFEVVGQAVDADSSIALARGLQPDVVLVDIEMPGGGLYATEALHRELPETLVVILTSDTQRSSVLRFLQAGAAAYLRKGTRPQELAERLCQLLDDSRFTGARRRRPARSSFDERIRRAMQQTAVGVAVILLDGHAAGQVTMANHRYAQMLGREPGELVGANVERWTHPDDLPEDGDHPLATLVSRAARRVEFDARYLHRCEYVVRAHVTAECYRRDDGAHAALIHARPLPPGESDGGPARCISDRRPHRAVGHTKRPERRWSLYPIERSWATATPETERSAAAGHGPGGVVLPQIAVF